MKKKLFSLLLFCLLIKAIPTVSQSGMPLKVSVFNEATAIPFNDLFTSPIHPGAQIGTEFKWKESKRTRLYPSVTLGYMFHNNLFQGVYLNGEMGFDFKFNFGLNLKSAIGLGYLHTFSTQQEFQLKNGIYESKSDQGNARIMPSLSLGFGYRLNPKSSDSAEVFVLYQSWIEYPYSPGFIPVMAHTSLHIGSKFYPFKK